MKYLIIIEPTDTGFSAYSPNLPGCVSTGTTRQEVEQNIREAVEFHVEGLQLEGMPVPEPSSESTYIEIAAYSADRRPAQTWWDRACSLLHLEAIRRPGRRRPDGSHAVRVWRGSRPVYPAASAGFFAS